MYLDMGYTYVDNVHFPTYRNDSLINFNQHLTFFFHYIILTILLFKINHMSLKYTAYYNLPTFLVVCLWNVDINIWQYLNIAYQPFKDYFFALISSPHPSLLCISHSLTLSLSFYLSIYLSINPPSILLSPLVSFHLLSL